MRHVRATLDQVYSDQAIDRMIELYCDWREASADVRAAYAGYSQSQPSDRALAFAAYGAALDQEQSASEAYAIHIVHMARAGDRVRGRT